MSAPQWSNEPGAPANSSWADCRAPVDELVVQVAANGCWRGMCVLSDAARWSCECEPGWFAVDGGASGSARLCGLSRVGAVALSAFMLCWATVVWVVVYVRVGATGVGLIKSLVSACVLSRRQSHVAPHSARARQSFRKLWLGRVAMNATADPLALGACVMGIDNAVTLSVLLAGQPYPHYLRTPWRWAFFNLLCLLGIRQFYAGLLRYVAYLARKSGEHTKDHQRHTLNTMGRRSLAYLVIFSLLSAVGEMTPDARTAWTVALVVYTCIALENGFIAVLIISPVVRDLEEFIELMKCESNNPGVGGNNLPQFAESMVALHRKSVRFVFGVVTMFFACGMCALVCASLPFSLMLSDVACAFVSIIGISLNLGCVIVLFKHADDPKADSDSSSRSAQSAHNMRNASAQDALSLQSQALAVRPTPRAV
jgi:hypothetical protein